MRLLLKCVFFPFFSLFDRNVAKSSGKIEVRESGVEDRKMAENEENFMKRAGKTLVDELTTVTTALTRIGEGSLASEPKLKGSVGQRSNHSNF